MKIFSHLLGHRRPPAIDPAVMNSLVIKELSLDIIKKIIDELAGGKRVGENDRFPVHILDLAFPDRIPFEFVRAALEKDAAFFSSMKPSEYSELLAAVEKANPRCVKIWRQLNRVARKALADEAAAIRKEGTR